MPTSCWRTELIDWPERTKTIQRNWIGRSEGAEVIFRDEELDVDIPVFTTRPDTLYGATFFVLAPEHPIVEKLATDEAAVEYVEEGRQAPVEERQTKEKAESSPATTSSIRSTTSGSRSGSPTTC